MTIPRFPASVDPSVVSAALGEAGCAIVERVASPAVLAQVQAEIAPYRAATPFGSDDFSGRRTRRTGGLIARSPACRDLIMHPVVVGAVRGILSHATSFHLHLTQLIGVGPDEPAQPIHRDQWAFDFFPFPAGYEVQCNTIWAMNDFTDENGATRVIPGSHRHADRQEYAAGDTLPAEMPLGSV